MIAALLACLPASAHASERRAAERQLASARQAVAAAVAREVAKVREAPPVWTDLRAAGETVVGGAPTPAAPAASAPSSEPPVLVEPPRITGGLHMGGTVECTRGVWDDTPEAPYPVTFRWLKDGTEVATGSALTLTRDDIEKTLVCVVTAAGQTEARSDEVGVPPPYPVEQPRFAGLPYVGRELSCDPGVWNDSPDAPYELSVRWERHRYERTEPMPGVRDSYTLTADDLSSSFTCIVTAEGDWEYEADWAYVSWTPVALRVTPLDDALAPGADGGYRLTLRNPNPIPVHPDEVQLWLPKGFTYRTGTTTGALSADPTVTPSYDDRLNLEWRADLLVPANGQLSFDVGVKAAPDVGDHFMRGYVSLDDPDVWSDDLYETARITVEPPFAQACTITGTEGDDELTGTPGDDVVCALGGDDVVHGLGGDDVLHGGVGSDRLDGGEGDDTLLGADGEDVLVTGPGADHMHGGGGLDSVSYANRREPVEVSIGDGSGPDGEAGEEDDVAGDIEIVRGGRGPDRLFGTPGDEELYGGAGDDELAPQAGEDLIEAGDGADFIDSGSYDAFTDRIFCGGGYDVYMAGREDRASACERELSRPERATSRVP